MSDPKEPTWLTVTQIRILHSESLQIFGGAPGLRDEGLLEGALDRARNRFHYDPGASLAELAASYGFGIARNHPFVDGNKRAALLAIRAFLFINGYLFAPDEIETVTSIEALAAGTLEEVGLALWVEANMASKS